MESDYWPRIGWAGSNGYFYEVDPDKPQRPPLKRADFESQLIAIDCGEFDYLGINWEPYTGGWQYLDPHQHLRTYTELTLELLDSVHALRPDVTCFLYIRPGLVNNATKLIDGASKICDIEERLRDITQHPAFSEYAAFSAYWHDGIDERVWQRRIDFAISMCTTVHDKKPLAFIWDNHAGWSGKRMDVSSFRALLQYLDDRGIDGVYWSPWGNPTEIHWETQWALWDFVDK
jgi:hypothetical protein